jgi:tetratricopeptide (TPR) repeat protein
MTGAVWCSAFVAAVLAVHPTHVESVTWIVERKDVLSTLFWLLTMLAYVRYVEWPGWPRYILVLVSFALGLMAKQMLVTLPAVLLLLDYWPLGRWRPGDAAHSVSWRRLVAEKLPLLLLAAAVIPLTMRAQTLIVKDLTEFPLGTRVENALISYVRYVFMLVWPVDLCCHYGYPDTIPLWKAGAAGAALMIVSAAVFALGRSRPYLPVGWLWYLGTLVPVIGLVQVGLQALADRYTYVPFIGLSVMVAWGAADLTAGWRSRFERLAVLAGALLAAWVIAAFLQVNYWRSNEANWRHALEIEPANHVSQVSLADEFTKQKKLDEAEKLLREVLRLDPSWVTAEVYLAQVLEMKGRVDEAGAVLEKSLQHHPEVAESHVVLSHIRARQNRFDDARLHLVEALRIKPDLVTARTNLGALLDSRGELAAAREQFEAAARLRPDNASIHRQLGNVLRKLDLPAEAVAHFDRALEIQPNSAEALKGKGLALESMGRFGEAAETYGRAVEQRPGDLILHCYLGYALAESGQSAAAADQYAESIRLEPNWPRQAYAEARQFAAHPDAQRRSGPKAVRTAKMACQATGFQDWQGLDVLAAAYAESGNFELALDWQRKAIALLPASAPETAGRELREHLRLYEMHQPLRLPNK